MLPRIRTVGLAFAAALGLAACTDGYGYSGVSLGYGSAGYYGDPYYGGGGYGGASYYGWNNGYYYPGTGYYVYDVNRRPVRWTSAQQRYWQARRSAYRGQYSNRPNWGGWDRREIRRDARGDRRVVRRDVRQDRREVRRDVRQDRREVRRNVRQDRREIRRDVRQDRRDVRPDRRGNRGEGRRGGERRPR